MINSSGFLVLFQETQDVIYTTDIWIFHQVMFENINDISGFPSYVHCIN